MKQFWTCEIKGKRYGKVVLGELQSDGITLIHNDDPTGVHISQGDRIFWRLSTQDEMPKRKSPRRDRRKQAEQRGEVPTYSGKPIKHWKLLQHDATDVNWLVNYFLGRGRGRLEITSENPAKTAQELRVDASLIAYGPKSHAAKFDSIMTDSMELLGMDEKLGMFFNKDGYRNGVFEIQIGYREFAELLISRGVLPTLPIKTRKKHE
jgi:hypothetical protein